MPVSSNSHGHCETDAASLVNDMAELSVTHSHGVKYPVRSQSSSGVVTIAVIIGAVLPTCGFVVQVIVIPCILLVAQLSSKLSQLLRDGLIGTLDGLPRDFHEDRESSEGAVVNLAISVAKTPLSLALA